MKFSCSSITKKVILILKNKTNIFIYIYIHIWFYLSLVLAFMVTFFFILGYSVLLQAIVKKPILNLDDKHIHLHILLVLLK